MFKWLRGVPVFGVVLLALVWASESRAERNEMALGAEVSLLLPGFESKSPTAFTLASWSVGAHFQYGLLDDLSLEGRFSFSKFGAKADNQTFFVSNREIIGDLKFDGTYYHPEIGAKYKVFSGHSIAPYVEAHLGYLFAIYRNQSLVNDAGVDIGVEPAAESQGDLTVSFGISVDYRIVDTFLVGIAFRYMKVVGNAFYDHHLKIPIQFSYYWF